MSVVYFIQAGRHGPIKIGYAADIAKRFRNISQGLPELAVLLATVPGGRPLELRLHRALHASRRRLEWFNPTPEVRAVAMMAGTKGLEPILRWLDRKEAAVEIRPLDFVATDDFEADVRHLTAMAFRLAIARHGKAAVAAAVDRSVDRVERCASGASVPGMVMFFNLAMLDPGACAPALARSGEVPAWIVEGAARDALDDCLKKLAPQVAA